MQQKLETPSSDKTQVTQSTKKIVLLQQPLNPHQQCQRIEKRDPIGLTVIWLCLGQISSLHWASIFSTIEIAIIWPTHLTEMMRLTLKTTIIQFIICIRVNYKYFIPIDSCDLHKHPEMYRWDYWDTERSNNLAEVTGLSPYPGNLTSRPKFLISTLC